MARPWRKRWPHVGRDGRKTYQLGYRDHRGKTTGKAFASAKLANEWESDYIRAERRGPESLRRFLDDLDAAEANRQSDPTSRAIGEVIQLYFALNAPEMEDGLAPSTFRSYGHSASRHLLGVPGMSKGKALQPAAYAVTFANQPAVGFNEAAAPRALREAMRHAKVGSSARDHAWRVLSAVLSWAAGSQLVPEIESNGCMLANEGATNRRKSTRPKSGGRRSRRRGEAVRSWALSPSSVEMIRAEMIDRADVAERPLLCHRDAMIASLQFGLALRNQEVYGFRWSELTNRNRARIEEVLSLGGLESSAKTERATGRFVVCPALLLEDLEVWRALLAGSGYRTRSVDFVIPGNLTRPNHGVIEADTGACHMTSNQAQKWHPRFLQPALNRIAEQSEAHTAIKNATPYSLRRGGISARLRGENAQSVAEQCGTSLEMLSQHYSYEIDEFSRETPETLDQQWRRARYAVTANRGSRALQAA
jgi:integrase